MTEKEHFEILQTIKKMGESMLITKEGLNTMNERLVALEHYIYGDGEDVKNIREVQNVNLKYTLENIKTINSNIEHISKLNEDIADLQESITLLFRK